jgi:hypothetical protein
MSFQKGTFLHVSVLNIGDSEAQKLDDGETDPVFKQPKKISLFRASSLNQEPVMSERERTLDRKRNILYKSSI